MTIPTDPAPASGADSPAPGSRIAFERLRERTDELELIISGMLAFALLTLPGRIFERWAANEVHVDGMFEVALEFGFLVAVGLSYALAVAFIIHLAIRGYWIALIGLKSTFPDGIRWERVPLMGPVAQAYYRRRISDLGGAIDRADRAASMLFAMAILLALSIAWVGVLAVAMILCAALLGWLAGDTERVATGVLIAAYAGFLAVGLLPFAAEKLIARNARAGRKSPRIARLVEGTLRAYGVLVPQRLILPVQLTLQSNLPGRGFMAVYVLVIVLAMVVGGLQVTNSSAFSILGGYRVVTTEAVENGLVSAHYESMRSEHDVLLRHPMIPSERIADTHLRLFIPHRPQLDNPLARERCAALPGGRNEARGAAAADAAVACLGALWTTTLDGAPLPLDGFLAAERRDLGMRGLLGYVPVAGLAPGRHDLLLVWHAQGPEDGPLRRREYRIPFWLTPGIEQAATR